MSWSRRGGLVLALGGMPLACSEPPAVGAGWSGTSDTGGTSGDTTSTTGPGEPPEVVDVGLDVLVLREGEAVVITAVVMDPDDDVLTGELHGPGEPASYGAMVPESADRWRATVTWSDVHERRPLTFERELLLPFTVRLVDARGHEAQGEVTVRAICGGLTDTACDGVCVDVQLEPTHCGECELVCADASACVNGLCQ